MPDPWDWSVTGYDTQHTDRLALLREIQFESSQVFEMEEPPSVPTGPETAMRGKALSLNMSPGGMLLLMDWRPEHEQVLRLQIPASAQYLRTPTLAEVRWIRALPFPGHQNLCLVGLRFLI